jgi:hypothetical protein
MRPAQVDPNPRAYTDVLEDAVFGGAVFGDDEFPQEDMPALGVAGGVVGGMGEMDGDHPPLTVPELTAEQAASLHRRTEEAAGSLGLVDPTRVHHHAMRRE